MVDTVFRPLLGASEGLEPGLFVVGVLAGLPPFGVLGSFYGPVLLVLAKAVGEELQEPVARRRVSRPGLAAGGFSACSPAARF